MTPRERAKQIIGGIGRYSSSAEILALIEPSIIAAIEEEREACAEIVRMKSLKHAFTDEKPALIFREAEEEIRARSDTD